MGESAALSVFARKTASSISAVARARGTAVGMRLFTRSVQARHWLSGFVRPSLRQLDHVTIPCADLGIAEDFYVGVLGARVMLRIDEAFLRRVGRPMEDVAAARHTSVLFSGGARIDLFEQREGQPPPLAGHPHFAFEVRPARALRSWRDRLRARGVPTFGPTQLGPPGQASLYFNDPFGNHLELTTLGYSDAIPIGAPDLAALRYEWSRP